MPTTDDAPRRTPGWQLDELATAGRENLDPAHAEGYDSRMDSAAEAEVELLRARGILGPGATVVDLGAGTGQFALAVAAADPTARVVAVDVSPVMLARLTAKATAAPLEVVHAGFLGYEHCGAPVDLVYSRFALHHLPDPWKVLALRRIHGMLRPGGWFRLWDVIYDAEPDELPALVDSWCAAPGDDWARWEYEEHVRDEHSTFRWLLEPMLDRCGFDVDDVVWSPDRMEGRYVLRARP
jgi:SAM-dependent methyltransferase